MKCIPNRLTTLALISLCAISFSASATETSPVNMPTEIQAAEARAKTALKNHLHLKHENFQVLAKQATEWPDTSLGCPRVGLKYPQMIVPGFKIQLKHADTPYQVHVSEKRAVVCENADAPNHQATTTKPVKLVNLQIEKITNDAKRELAKRIGVQASDITISSIKPVTWNNQALGCPEHGVSYNETPVKGFRIILHNRGREYSYHTDQDSKLIACPKIESI